MNWRQRIIVDWPNDPQRAHKAKEALRVLEECLLTLSGLGHPLHVEEGYLAPPKPEWPKPMFHIYQGARVFNCQADLDEAGEDWYPTMEDARFAAGLTKQNQRGGIFAKALPMALQPDSEGNALAAEAERVAKEAKRTFIAEQRAIHRANGALEAVPLEKRNARQID